MPPWYYQSWGGRKHEGGEGRGGKSWDQSVRARERESTKSATKIRKLFFLKKQKTKTKNGMKERRKNKRKHYNPPPLFIRVEKGWHKKEKQSVNAYMHTYIHISMYLYNNTKENEGFQVKQEQKKALEKDGWNKCLYIHTYINMYVCILLNPSIHPSMVVNPLILVHFGGVGAWVPNQHSSFKQLLQHYYIIIIIIHI